MKFVLVLVGISTFGLAAQSALTSILPPTTTLVRAPHLDSAIIHSDRIGANFAYSTVEGHAYQAITPIVRTALHPVQIRYQLNAIPVDLPTTQHLYVQHPILSHLAPAQTIEIAADSPAYPAAEAPAAEENNQNDQKNLKIDDDTVTIESA